MDKKYWQGHERRSKKSEIRFWCQKYYSCYPVVVMGSKYPQKKVKYKSHQNTIIKDFNWSLSFKKDGIII